MHGIVKCMIPRSLPHILPLSALWFPKCRYQSPIRLIPHWWFQGLLVVCRRCTGIAALSPTSGKNAVHKTKEKGELKKLFQGKYINSPCLIKWFQRRRSVLHVARGVLYTVCLTYHWDSNLLINYMREIPYETAFLKVLYFRKNDNWWFLPPQKVLSTCSYV